MSFFVKYTTEMHNLLLTKPQSFGLVQIESICRWHNICESKTEIHFGKSRKHFGKKRKYWLPAFSSFPTMFSKGYRQRVVKLKSWDCVVKSYCPFDREWLINYHVDL